MQPERSGPGEEDPQKQEMLKLAALGNARYNRVMTRRANAAAEAARKAVQEQHEAAAAAYRATQEAWARVQAEQWAQQQQAAQQYHDWWYYGGSMTLLPREDYVFHTLLLIHYSSSFSCTGLCS